LVCEQFVALEINLVISHRSLEIGSHYVAQDSLKLAKPCLHPSAGITGVYHHGQLIIFFDEIKQKRMK
jgi:hypothetical protein